MTFYLVLEMWIGSGSRFPSYLCGGLNSQLTGCKECSSLTVLNPLLFVKVFPCSIYVTNKNYSINPSG